MAIALQVKMTCFNIINTIFFGKHLRRFARCRYKIKAKKPYLTSKEVCIKEERATCTNYSFNPSQVFAFILFLQGTLGYAMGIPDMS